LITPASLGEREAGKGDPPWSGKLQEVLTFFGILLVDSLRARFQARDPEAWRSVFGRQEPERNPFVPLLPEDDGVVKIIKSGYRPWIQLTTVPGPLGVSG
jgi:hypothetical protein